MRLAVVLFVLGSAAIARAQEAAPDPTSEAAMLAEPDVTAVPVAPSSTAPVPPGGVPSSYDVLSWEVLPGGPEGIQNPVLITHPDYGLMVAGAVMAGISYVLAASLSVFFGAIGGCWWGPCQPELATLGLIPLAEWSAGFSGTGSSAGAFISGGVLAPIELVGLIILLAGALHHHPQIVPRDTVRRPRREE